MINGALFFLTFLTTTVGGSLFQGGNPFSTPVDLARGLPYSIPLMSILLAHELGHYFACRRHRLKATLPYFIPVPPPIFLFGTLGAFIKIKSPIQDRRALLDVGVAGPLAGMVLAVPVAAIGISLSEFVPFTGEEGNLLLGESLLFRFLMELIKGSAPEGAQLLLHPMAFAGWIGFLVTAFNLLPASQLDGGHIFYSLWPRRHRLMTRLVVLSLLVLGLVAWQGWVLWGLAGYAHGYETPACSAGSRTLRHLAVRPTLELPPRSRSAKTASGCNRSGYLRCNLYANTVENHIPRTTRAHHGTARAISTRARAGTSATGR